MLAEMHRSAVEEARDRGARPCGECGTPMTMGTGTETGAYRTVDVFTPVAVDGTTYGPASDLVFLFDPAANWLGAGDPYAYLARLGDLCMSATSAKRTETTWLYERTIREYTSLKVRLDMGPTYHQHAPASVPWTYDPSREVIGDRACVYHCGWPAWLRPSGWYCRECRELLTDATAEIRMVPVYAGEALPPTSAVPREARGGYGQPGLPTGPVKRLPPLCEVCSRRDATAVKVPRFGGRLVCAGCIGEAQAAGILA